MIILELVYNEQTKEWEQKKEPFITIAVETEEDFEFIGNAVAFYKKHIEEQEKQQTNADRIRAMSDEELAELVSKYVYCGLCPLKHRCIPGECRKTVMEWLKQPAEEVE